MYTDLPDIAKAAARARTVIEESVQRFARRNRYSVGADLRDVARQVVRLTLLAWHEPSRRALRIRELSSASDGLKLDLQLAKDVNAFRHDREFEMVGRLVKGLGAQCGGWLSKELERKGQNGRGQQSRAQRAPILSGRPASAPGAKL